MVPRNTTEVPLCVTVLPSLFSCNGSAGSFFYHDGSAEVSCLVTVLPDLLPGIYLAKALPALLSCTTVVSALVSCDRFTGSLPL